MAIKTKGSRYRSFDGKIKTMQKDGQWLYGVEIWLLNDKINRNNWQFTDMEGHMEHFRGTPILIAYINDGKGIGDGHNYTTEMDPNTGEMVPSFTGATAERIVGSLSDDPADFRLEQRDGNTWIVGKGTLWAWYAREVVEKIENDARQGRSMSISIEALVTKSHMNGKTEVEDEYEILGTTILGDHVLPAVADARITALRSIGTQFAELKLKAASYQKEGRKMPKNNEKGVKNQMEYLSKQQLADLGKRFSGYTVLAAAKGENDSILVCLMQDEQTFAYCMASAEETIAPEKFVKVNAQTAFPFGENVAVEIDTCEVTGVLAERMNTALKEAERANEKVASLSAELEKMQTAENARRLSAAKAKAESTLEAFNANREEKVDVKVLEALTKEIESGKYTKCADENGNWIGESAVEKEVKALCADAVMKADEKNARNNKSTFAWSKVGGKNAADDGSVSSLLHRKGIR